MILTAAVRQQGRADRLRIAEIRTDMRQVATDNITHRLLRLAFDGSQRRDHAANVVLLDRLAIPDDTIVKRANQQRHNAEGRVGIEILQEHHFQLDRMFRQMGRQFVVEQAVAVVRDEAVDIGLIRESDAERRLEVFARQREPLRCNARCR